MSRELYRGGRLQISSQEAKQALSKGADEGESAKQGVMFFVACSNPHEHDALLWSGGDLVKALQIVDDVDRHAPQTPEVSFCVKVEV